MLDFLRQAALWTLAICLAVITVGWLLSALDERREDNAAFDPELVKRFRQDNAKIATRRAAETHKQDGPNAA